MALPLSCPLNQHRSAEPLHGCDQMGDECDANLLLLRATLAANTARQRPGRIAFYEASMVDSVQQQMAIEVALREAVLAAPDTNFTMLFQPQIDARSGRMIGAEMLLRWHHAELGWISPVQFIPIAEQIGLIIPLTEWLLQQLCATIARWRQHYPEIAELTIYANIVSHHFASPNFVKMIRQVLRQHQIPGQQLGLEITEGAMISSVNIVSNHLQALRELGVCIAIDDFGTGYSSLHYLRTLPIDKLKIDRSFVMDIPNNREQLAIVQAITSMAMALDLQCVGEGVESEQQLATLQQFGCHLIQGYYFSKPLPEHDFIALLQQRNGAAGAGQASNAPAAVPLHPVESV